MRVVVGLSNNITDPEALKSLQEFATVRVGDGGSGIFHPKFYLFSSAGKAICWVGSANFTNGGFTKNSELVNEFVDNGTASRWFETLWNSLTSDSDERIKQYTDEWTPPTGTRNQKTVPADSLIEDPIQLLAGEVAPQTWNDYVVALQRCDAYWRKKQYHFCVLGAERSYFHTISKGLELIRRNNWIAFTDDEIDILLGRDRPDQGAWGLLGSMKGAATAVGTSARMRMVCGRSFRRQFPRWSTLAMKKSLSMRQLKRLRLSASCIALLKDLRHASSPSPGQTVAYQ